MKWFFPALVFIGVLAGCSAHRPPETFRLPTPGVLEENRRVGALRDARCVSLLKEQGKIRQYGEGLAECVRKGTASDMLYVSPLLRGVSEANQPNNQIMLWVDAQNAVFRELYKARAFCEKIDDIHKKERCVRRWLFKEENRLAESPYEPNPLLQNIPVIDVLSKNRSVPE